MEGRAAAMGHSPDETGGVEEVVDEHLPGVAPRHGKGRAKLYPSSWWPMWTGNASDAVSHEPSRGRRW
jgi:hypothetical protein